MSQVQVTVNAIPITQLPTATFYHYDVAFEQEDLFRRRAYEIIDRLQTKAAPNLFTPRGVYDGKKNMFVPSTALLGPAHEFTVNMSDKEPGTERSLFRIRIKRVQSIDPNMLNQVLQRNHNFPEEQVAIMVNVLQLLIRQTPSMKYPHNARSAFSSRDVKALPRGAEIWRGYFQSVRLSLGRAVINVDISSGVMIMPGNLIEVSLKFQGERDARSIRPDPHLKRFLKGRMIHVTSDPRGKNRRISDVVERAGQFVFNKDGENMTVEKYFQQFKNVTVRYPTVFGVVVGKESVIPAELCEILPGQLLKRTLTPDQTQEVLSFTTKKPQERLNMIMAAKDFLDYRGSDYIRQSGMQIAYEPLTVRGTRLNFPELLYGGGSVRPAEGKWNVVRQRLSTPATLRNWSVIVFDSRARSSMGSFIPMFMQCCRDLGMTIPQEQPTVLFASDQGDIHLELQKAGMAAIQNFSRHDKQARPQLILCVLPMVAPDLRKAIKHWGDVLNGVATQCVRGDKVAKANNQYGNNLVLKVNVKLMGTNSIPKGAGMKLITKPTMVVGADVSHPGPGIRNQPSVTSLVASYDEAATQYVAFTNVQAPRFEIIDDLDGMIADAIQTFGGYWKGKVWPQQIIFYRDGVSDGELSIVREEELPKIQKGIDLAWSKNELPEGKKPEIVFIIVGKRHHVRFFPRQGEADRSGNCMPGLSVAEGVTGNNPNVPDFYLLSHGGLLGTSCPAHYMVLRNDPNHPLVALQEFSYALCYAYARATRSVSIPAPVYYADLVCSRAQFHFVQQLQFSDTSTNASGDDNPFDLDLWKSGYLPISRKGSHYRTMYWM